jgi:hypothetical protein
VTFLVVGSIHYSDIKVKVDANTLVAFNINDVASLLESTYCYKVAVYNTEVVVLSIGFNCIQCFDLSTVTGTGSGIGWAELVA